MRNTILIAVVNRKQDTQLTLTYVQKRYLLLSLDCKTNDYFFDMRQMCTDLFCVYVSLYVMSLLDKLKKKIFDYSKRN